MELTGKNLIGNELSATGTNRFQAKNPSDNTQLPVEFSEAESGEVDAAVRKARSAFSAFSTAGVEARADFLEAIGDEILALGDELIARCHLETALPEGRLNGERMRTVNQLKLFASLIREGSWVNARIDTGDSTREPLPKPDVRQMQKPLGPVGIFGASNFPLAFSVAGGDTASALAAGCPVVVKAHPLHPGTSEMVGKAILQAANKTGMPDGVFSMIHGHSEPGRLLVMHEEICAIGFTGSFQGGKALFNLANNRRVPIPVYAEMGSSNPVFLLPGALKERSDSIAKGLAASVCLGAGQFCTNPGLLVSQKDNDDFTRKLASALEEQQPGTMLGDSIRENYESLSRGMASKTGVTQQTSMAESNVIANLFTTEASDFLADKTLEEEVFGPSTLMVSAGNKEELLKLAASLGGHLTATIHGTAEELEEYADLIEILEGKAGRIIFNGYPTGVEVCHSMHHGGPYPATTAPQTTSVGTMAIYRFTKPVCYQDFPQASLPAELRDANPRGILRLLNGEYTRS